MTATIPAGMKLHEVSELLWNKGYALSNQGDVDVQSIAGLIGTGVHGTGLKHPTISSYVQDATLVLNTGDIIKAADNSEILEATRLNLGALGIVIDVTLSVVPTFFLQEQAWEKDAGAAKVFFSIFSDGAQIIDLEIRYKGQFTPQPQFQGTLSQKFIEFLKKECDL